MYSTRRIWAAAASMAAAFAIFILANPASAGVVAYSTLQISEFKITSGGKQIITDEKKKAPIVNNATSSRASFNGVPGVAASDTSDAPMACVGDCGAIGQNNFARVSDFDNPLHFARGDVKLSGSLLETDGVAASTVAEAQLTKNEGANAGGEASTSSFFWTIEFEGISGDITLEFDAFGRLLAASDIVGGSAEADFTWTLSLFNITDEVEVMSFIPSELNQSVAVDGIDTAFYELYDQFVINVNNLLADHRYRLIISHNSDIDAFFQRQAAEPASMTVLGLGIVALGGMAARRRKAA